MNITVDLSTLIIEVETSPKQYDVEIIQNTIETNTQPIIIEAEILGYANAGQSAYEVWLGKGNIGTEEQFLLSLKGDQPEIDNQTLEIKDNVLTVKKLSIDGGLF